MKKIIIGAVIVVALAIAIIGTAAPAYDVDSEQIYARDGQECIAYRVVIDGQLTEDELIEVYTDVTDGDGYYLHTVWYYTDAADINNGSPFATLEQFEEGADPVFE